MSYPANVYNIMLASPSDVSEERVAAKEIILDWNNINSISRKIILQPTGWEHNSTPTMGDRPQQIINKQVLSNADLLVGIFWTRIGTPTGKAPSGSIEEIEEHISSGKPAMLYFSNKPVVPSSIDQEQYQAVLALKAEYQTRGLTDTFSSVEDFKAKFQRHLALKINQDDFFQGFNVVLATENGVDNLISKDIALSEDAKKLLIAASDDGEIARLNYIGGFTLETNNIEFVNDDNPRSKARWEDVLNELERNELIVASNYKREIFNLTNRGYIYADSLKDPF